ncbi:MAG: heavy-metal-associated domain-containing protein [Chitinophagaceae bacterium]
MKALRIFSIATLFMAVGTFAVAQTKTETFKVSGNCGMCKTKIEKAAKDAGAKEASWDADTKNLTVTYKSSTTNTAKIQEKIASVGYDNVGATATTEAYDKLHGCCKYERTAAVSDGAKMDCCKDGKCTMPGHDGKDCCKKDGEKMDCSKMNGEKMDCCKDGKCSMPGHDGKDCCKKDGAKMDCCKDGKCTMPGHDGKDCCKKSEK